MGAMWVHVLIFCCGLVGGATYENPLVPHVNLPDPGAIHWNGRYYVATTTVENDATKKYPIRSSTDLISWKLEGHIFEKGKNLPSWGSLEDWWAPEIHRIGDAFVVYFAARDKTGVLCVGAAYSREILGSYKDIGAPLVRNASVGNIDPHYHFERHTGIGYLIWKEDGNGRVPPEKYTPIWAQPLAADGLSLLGTKTNILQNDPDSWEGPLVEAPWMIFTRGLYYLFYSANGYAGPAYAVGVARSKKLLGPYEKWSQNPIVHSNGNWSGPGHCSVLRVANTSDSYFMLYHSWVAGQILGDYPRELIMDAIQWTKDGWPHIKDFVPSSGPTVVPH